MLSTFSFLSDTRVIAIKSVAPFIFWIINFTLLFTVYLRFSNLTLFLIFQSSHFNTSKQKIIKLLDILVPSVYPKIYLFLVFRHIRLILYLISLQFDWKCHGKLRNYRKYLIASTWVLQKWHSPFEKFINWSLCSVKIALWMIFHWNCFSLLLHNVSLVDFQIDFQLKVWLNTSSHFASHLGLYVSSIRWLFISLNESLFGSSNFCMCLSIISF